MRTTLESILGGREEICCPDCKRPLVVSALPDGKHRFDGCGRNCRELYDLPDDCIIFGPVGGVMTIYQPKRARVAA